MTDDHQRQLVEIWNTAMAEWTQVVLGSIRTDDFSPKSILSLSTGREKLSGRRTLRAGTPNRHSQPETARKRRYRQLEEDTIINNLKESSSTFTTQ